MDTECYSHVLTGTTFTHNEPPLVLWQARPLNKGPTCVAWGAEDDRLSRFFSPSGPGHRFGNLQPSRRSLRTSSTYRG